MTGNTETLAAMLKEHLGPADQSSPSQPTKQLCIDTETDKEDCDDAYDILEAFTFQCQGQWVAVYYDNQFYIGQVFDIKNADTADIKFLEQTKGRKDFFRWPANEDIAEVHAQYVFR